LFTTPNKLKSYQISCLAFVFQGVMKIAYSKLRKRTQIICAHIDTRCSKILPSDTTPAPSKKSKSW
ncbi:MAG TPA: hypothetical protein PKD51_20495, partial [Saprospiraceae bacterium]|nr:hypothetical protein [Saprospiraceae bacterium]